MSLPPHPLHAHPSTQPRHPALRVCICSATDPPPALPRVHTAAVPPSCVLPCSSRPASTSPSCPPRTPVSLRVHSDLPHALPCPFYPASESTRACSALSSPSPHARPDAPLARILPALPPCTPAPDPGLFFCAPVSVPAHQSSPAQYAPPPRHPPVRCPAYSFPPPASCARLYAPACMWARLSRYTPILGILSTVLIVVVILVDGVTKTESPGSLWSPADMSFGIDNWNHLGIVFGPFMAGFSGHAVIPSLARDMTNTTANSIRYFRASLSYIVATSIYALIGCAGYLIFGKSVSQEISMEHPSSKFALTTQPLNNAIHIFIGIDSPIATPEELEAKLTGPHRGLRTSPKSAGHSAACGGGIALRCCVHPRSEFSAASMHIWRRRVGAFPACVRLRLVRDLYLARVVVWGMNWVPRICTARLDVYAAHILLSRGARKCEARVDVSAVLRRSFLLAWSGEHRRCASAIVQAIFIQAQGWGSAGDKRDGCMYDRLASRPLRVALFFPV
ncbi:hypothetical protein B0H14DRAFT_3460417 [Mycena olivaceomarginata]|nr:hypothetical protein B0H14DRAFT_3460417 [Mycena olivaceomarginata]